MNLIIQIAYLAAAGLFIVGLRRMSSPATTRDSLVWVGAGMALAIVVTLLWPGMQNRLLILIAIAIGSVLAWASGRTVAMSRMPQMIALYSGMGGGAVGAIAALELLKPATGHGTLVLGLTALAGVVGVMSLSGSLVAFGKFQGLVKGDGPFGGQQQEKVYLAAAGGLAVLGLFIVFGNAPSVVVFLLLVIALVVGVLVILPVDRDDMPVAIALFNALTGLAVAFEGLALNNAAMVIVGALVGAAGILLTRLMSRAMGRPLGDVFIAKPDTVAERVEQVPATDQPTPLEKEDTGAADLGSADPADDQTEQVPLAEERGPVVDVKAMATMLSSANKVVIVPGYGMAVAQAQHRVWELAESLSQRGVEVRFAIHPMAGRLPGHMDQLLAEAGVPYDAIDNLEQVNAGLPATDVALVVGANDIVNPAARTDRSSPLYGMPILDVDKARHCIVIKRGSGPGYSEIENDLYSAGNTRMLYGDAQVLVGGLAEGLKAP